ncbi:MAG: hypothetical protein RLZZ422_2724, partial [Pseudomonadota bacterium]
MQRSCSALINGSDRINCTEMNETALLTQALSPKLEGQTTHQWVYYTLRQAVLAGVISPGQSVTLRGLASELAVSAMPVREAIHRLCCEGALVMLDNRRIQVPRMTRSKLHALYELRIILETQAAVTALPYIQTQHIEVLRQLDDAIDSAYAGTHVGAGSLANQAFHRYLYEANPHQVSVPLIERLWLQLGPFWRVTASLLDEYYQIDRHQEMITALERKNAFALQRALEADIRDGMAA